MMEKPILFNGTMVKAILDGRKTQTRRVIKLRPSEDDCIWCEGQDFEYIDTGDELSGYDYRRPCRCRMPKCPYGKPGDELWMRETWYSATKNIMDNCLLGYRADGDHPHGQSYYIKPSIHMPRWASRIQLRVKDVRVERVQEISEADAMAEGDKNPFEGHLRADGMPIKSSARLRFKFLWDCINAKRGYGWDINPWVWVIEFERIITNTQEG